MNSKTLNTKTLNTKLQGFMKEFSKLTHVETLKSEVNRLASDIKARATAKVLDPKTYKTLKKIETEYDQLKKNFAQVQNQVDVEMNKAAKAFKQYSGHIEKALSKYKAKYQAKYNAFVQNGKPEAPGRKTKKSNSPKQSKATKRPSTARGKTLKKTSSRQSTRA